MPCFPKPTDAVTIPLKVLSEYIIIKIVTKSQLHYFSILVLGSGPIELKQFTITILAG